MEFYPLRSLVAETKAFHGVEPNRVAAFSRCDACEFGFVFMRRGAVRCGAV